MFNAVELKLFKFGFSKMRLSENASKGPGRYFSMLWYNCGDQATLDSFGKFNVTAGLARFVKTSLQEFTPDFAIRSWFHAAMSSSNCLILGGKVATGGVKCRTSASFKFSIASSSVLPCDATSTSRHWAIYQSPSLNTTALKFLVISDLFYHFPGDCSSFCKYAIADTVFHGTSIDFCQ